MIDILPGYGETMYCQFSAAILYFQASGLVGRHRYFALVIGRGRKPYVRIWNFNDILSGYGEQGTSGLGRAFCFLEPGQCQPLFIFSLQRWACQDTSYWLWNFEDISSGARSIMTLLIVVKFGSFSV
jgi:hypothetical protein